MAGHPLKAQCTNPVNSFPYTENFETSNGGWVPGGTASDWSWGTPIKPVISSAASGSKCWITGTLTQSSYSNNQNSTLTSPCFDFTGLSQPYIKFSIFWETEKKYDGASFQYSIDGGNSWTSVPEKNRPVADSGEACFAASGTNIRSLDKDEAVFVSGGRRSHIFIRDQKILLPILQGQESTGANSVAVWDSYQRKGGDRIVVVGGDFNKRTSDSLNCFYSFDRGKHWKASRVPPHGYRSCVEYLDKKVLVACGLTGVDYTVDNAQTWKWISKESFHVCRIAKMGTSVFLAGGNGKIGRLVFQEK